MPRNKVITDVDDCQYHVAGIPGPSQVATFIEALERIKEHLHTLGKLKSGTALFLVGDCALKAAKY